MKRAVSLFLSLVITLGAFIGVPLTVVAADTTDAITDFYVDKQLASLDETVTLTIKVADGYKVNSVWFYKPITNNTETVFPTSGEENTYTYSFRVGDQTESGIWKVKAVVLRDSDGEFVFIYNSDKYTGTTSKKADFSALDFEVIGTNADVTPPQIDSYSIDKTTVSSGEAVTITANITDEHLSSSFYLWYKSPNDEDELILMKQVDNTGTYQGTFTVDSNTEIGVWRPYRFSVYDSNNNSCHLYNSNVISYGSNRVDLSSLNFEVVKIVDSPEVQETFIVIFKDGYGNTLSTQRVSKGESAVEPEVPIVDMYVFDGWDCDFSNVSSNLTVTAKWVVDPDTVYDYEIHQDSSFAIEVFSQTSQNYTVTCNEDIDFSSVLTGTGILFTNGVMYYSRKFEITVNESGSYLFYVKGSLASNVLKYKVKVTPHMWEDEYSVDVKGDCVTDEVKSIHCSLCDCSKADTKTVTPAPGHTASSEWVRKAATCTSDGFEYKPCTVCGAKLEKTVFPATGHMVVVDSAVQPTCTLPGLTEGSHCNLCGEGINPQLEIPPLGHTPTDWIIDKKATVNSAGTKHKECKTCGEILETAAITQLKPATPKIASASNTVSGVKVTWGKVTGADSYIVYRRAYNTQTKSWGSWSKVAIDETGVSFVDKNAKSGTYYRYTVRARNKAGLSGYETYGVKIYFLATPKLVSASNLNGGIYVKWNKVTGASGYYLYRKTGNGGWSKIATLSGNSKVTYTDTTAKAGTNYTYTVRAYNGKTLSWFNTGLTLRRLTTPKLASVSSAKAGVTVKWNKVTGASGYYVYRKTGNGSWSKIATVSGNGKVSYLDKSAKKGTTYTYTVRAYYGKSISYYNTTGLKIKDKY